MNDWKWIGLLVVLGTGAAGGNPNVHLTYHWHQHQPIYWPERNNGEFSPGVNRYQFAYDSIRLKESNGGNYYTGSSAEHPQNQLWQGDGGAFDEVFSKDDRISAYQHGMRDSIGTITGHPNAGVSISYSGSLQENIGSLGRGGRGGYDGTWNQPTATARGWTTGAGHSRADLLGMTYHHSFSPLLPKSVLRKEVAIFREIWWKSWSGSPDKSDHSKGFWPIEAAFSRHMIPILKEFGYEWSIVANSHLARTCQNYLEVAPGPGNNTWNNVPPNRSDRLGPHVPAGQWWTGTQDGRGGIFPAPFAYQAHQAQYIDPETGQEEHLIVVPMCDLLSYQNGFATMGTGEIDSKIAPFANDAGHPVIVLMAHDGDNAWGGGSSYYFESVPGLMNEAADQGYQPSSIEYYLGSLDRNNLDVVHVEDGTWVNADDRGSPAFYHWLFPPQRARNSGAGYDSDDPKTWADFETPGFSEDFRNWAVVVAGANYLETAEQLWTDGGGEVLAWKIQEPTQVNGTDNNPNLVEQGWHFYLGGLDSGFLYYGSSLDDEMKQSLAQVRALEVSDGSQTLKQYVENNLSADATPPTVFKPQRYPWNPGGMDFGNHIGFRSIGLHGADPWESEFHVWTHVHDVSGVQTVTLKVRVDGDGLNPLETTDNEVYAVNATTGSSWIDLPMTRRVLDPSYNPDPDPGNAPNDPGDINFFIQPHAIADYHFAKVDDSVVPAIRGALLDYYVEAVDSRGNIHRSEIQHVYVEDDGASSGGGGTSPEPFQMDGVLDSAGYLLDGADLSLYAAVRGDMLYVATDSPEEANGNDHFILVGDSVLGTSITSAPWAKAGTIATPDASPFLAAESTNSYLGWFHADSATKDAARGGAGQVMEGVISLTGVFGARPAEVFLAALAYQTADGGALVAQAPPGDGGNVVDPGELLRIPLEVLRDEDANGVYDRLEPTGSFRFIEVERLAGSALRLRWNCFPGRRYGIESSGDLDDWQPVEGSELTAGPGELELELTLTGQSATGKFYRAVLEP